MVITTTERAVGLMPESNVIKHDVYELMANYMVNNMERVRATLDSFIKCLEGAEKAKAQEIKQQVEDYLEKLKKAKQMSGLQKFFKALGILGFILALISAVFFPSPMTIGLAIASAALFLEPLLAQAAGNPSVIEGAISAVFEALKDHLGMAGATVMAAVVMITIAACISVVAAGGVGIFIAATQSSFESLKNFTDDFVANLIKFLRTNNPEEEALQSTSLARFLEVAQTSVLLAQGGVQVGMATLQLEIAKLMKAYDISGAHIQQWSQIINQVNNDANFYQDLRAELDSLMTETTR